MERIPLFFIGSPEQDEPEVIKDSPPSVTSDTMGWLSGSLPPWPSELFNAVSGYDNDQREGEVSCETFHGPFPSEYEATQQLRQNFLPIYEVGRFPAVPPPALATCADVMVSPTNASDTQIVDQHNSCDCMVSSTAYTSNSPAVDMAASPIHHDGGYYHFGHQYPLSVMVASSHTPCNSFNASPEIPTPFSASGSSESSISRRPSPVYMGKSPAMPCNGSLVTDHDSSLTDNIATLGPLFYPCSFDNCQEWISDDKRLMKDHLAKAHDIHLRGDPDADVMCRWNGCAASVMKSNFPRHVLKHLEVRWECSVCQKDFSRSDSVLEHFKRREMCLGGTPTRLVNSKAHRRQMFGDKVVLTKVHGG